MADLSMEALERFSKGVSDVGGQFSSDLAGTLGSIDLHDREMVEDLVVGASRSAAHAANEYAGAYYRGMSIIQTGEDARIKAESSFDERATRIAVRGIYKQADLGDGELDEAMIMRQVQARVSFEANRASKVGVWRRGRLDVRGVRFARVPVGAETCAWCLMTAGLGYWYMTEEAASHTHAHCDCVILPEIAGASVESAEGYRDVSIRGYSSAEYRRMWQAARGTLARGDVPQELLDRVDRLAATRDRYRMDTNGVLAVMRWQHGLK